jgi:uncharacterized membrane protein YgcG
MVTTSKLHRFVDKARIRAALTEAARTTSAPIHVSVAPYFWGSVRRTAERAFHKHGLARTPHRNGVLFFVVPSRRQFVIIGDAGAHEALGQAVWDAVAEAVQEHFRHGDPTRGLELGIEQLARHLAAHFRQGPEARSL